MEWKNEFNSFNSWKGLLYSKWYQSVRDWKDGKIKAPLPPVEASFDPIHRCNLLCDHCNANRYITGNKEAIRMSNKHMHDLTKFLGDWGVKAVCYGGGGEPTMHSELANTLDTCTASGMQSSMATNGTLFTKDLISSMARNCRWVGISIDAATPQAYANGRKKDMFNTAIGNMSLLLDEVKSTSSKCDVSYKFLIFKYNQHEIFDACLLAKKLGARDFHARPADYSHQGMGDLKDSSGSYNIETVLEQFKRCHEIETDDFRVFTVVHKFDSNMKPKKGFSQCYASPCCIQLCADNNVYLCPDQRFSPAYKIASHANVEDIRLGWGGTDHYNLVFNSGKKMCTSRCTFNTYNKQCEELFISDNDPMCKNFI